MLKRLPRAVGAPADPPAELADWEFDATAPVEGVARPVEEPAETPAKPDAPAEQPKRRARQRQQPQQEQPPTSQENDGAGGDEDESIW